MLHTQGTLKNICHLLAVSCGETIENKLKQDGSYEKKRFPFPEIVSSGRLEVQKLTNPTIDEFRKVLDSWQPNFVHIQGEILPNDEVGSVVWRGLRLSAAEALSELFCSTMPAAVYLELQNGTELAETLHSKGIPCVIYWKDKFSHFEASHFHNALFSVVQSSLCHTWDAFQLAHASFRLHCRRNSLVTSDSNQNIDCESGPNLLGEAPKIDVQLPGMELGEDDEGSSSSLPAIKIYDDDMYARFLVCGVASSLDTRILGPLEDGLNSLLSIEMRGSKLHNRVSAFPPPLQAASLSREVVTMRCDLSTCSSAHISLLVSGSAQTCFDDQLLENHIKNEIIENSQLVHELPNNERRAPVSEPRRSVSVACGAAVFEVCMKVPTWASQVLIYFFMVLIC
ncbi:AT-rich interactive domain-containing protein 4 [Dorcoceras hygrometricum]|uniref:AT-rich interactive domain-containing protein 4 n=1 Tax=Dorcoceras hygrometricum TaxID=472368 RepID=A0A2Z7ADB3_9LAMI|nr:AT-rich interactive domain-containing protein 4 [Dorcoceras hygrometricum]